MIFSWSSFDSQKLLDNNLRNYKMQHEDMNHFQTEKNAGLVTKETYT